MREQAIAEGVEATLQQILKQLADLSERVARVEKAALPPEAATPSAAAVPVASAPAAAVPPVAITGGISESELLAISAALAAYLGVRPDIRQIRLIGADTWSLYGRASIQASHRPKR